MMEFPPSLLARHNEAELLTNGSEPADEVDIARLIHLDSLVALTE